MIQIKDKKGFMFVISVFLILTYILISISVWVKGLEASERSYSEIYKQSNVELAVAQLTPEKIGLISDLIMQRAVFSISTHSITDPVKAGQAPNDENYYIRQATFQYLANGTPSADNFEGDAPAPEVTSSLAGWVGDLNTSLAGIGVYIDNYQLSDFQMAQESVDIINYSYRMKLTMKDAGGVSSLSRDYNVHGKVNITGYVDSSIVRESDRSGEPVYRRFFFYPSYQVPADVAPSKMSQTVTAGQGWFYGYVIDSSAGASIPKDKRHLFILVGDYASITGLSDYADFGGYIVTNRASSGVTCTSGSGVISKGEGADTFNAITYNKIGSNCNEEILATTKTSKPFAVIPGFTYTSAPSCPNLINVTGATRCALFTTTYSQNEVETKPSLKNSLNAETSGLFDIEKLRDYTMCGYYVKNPQAPSYLQRFFKDSYKYNSTEFGVETFLIGEYVSSANTFDFGKFSNLDREMFTNTDKQEKLRGMPGCKSFDACSSDQSTGKFGLSTNATGNYESTPISCKKGARCD